MTVFTDAVEDGECVVEGGSDECQECGYDGEVYLEVADEQLFSEGCRCNVCTCSDCSECDANVVDESGYSGESVADVAETNPDVCDDGEE